MQYLPDLGHLVLLILVFIPAEHFFALNKGQNLFRRDWINDMVYYVVNGPITGLGVSIIILGIIVATECLMPTWIGNTVSSQSYWLQTIEVIVLADLGLYGTHLAFHKISWLWKFHAVHHSIEELDWLAAYRVHPVDQIITKGVSLLPIFALGFSEVAIAVFALIYNWHAILLHANVKIDFGPLRWIVASPEFHRWHHANQPEAYDKNFAGQLSVLDVLFRTAYMPKDRCPSQYGTNERVPQTYFAQLVYPFQMKRSRNLNKADQTADTDAISSSEI